MRPAAAVIPGIATLAAAALIVGWATTRSQAAPPSIAPEPESALTTLATVQAAIDRNNQHYLGALLRGDADAYAQVFTEDGISLPAHDPIARGRAAIRDALAETFKEAKFTGGEIHTIETHLEGETAYEVGDYTFQLIINGRMETSAGRYLTVWKRVGDDWKIAIDAGQPGAPRR